MEFVDLAAQQRRIKELLDQRIQEVLRLGQYIMGPEVGELEQRLAAYADVKHAIGCASGTDALLLALMAYGVGPGDAILTTPFTFVATAEVISLLGATPVFVDIDPATFNIDPAQLEKAIIALKANDPFIHPLPLTHYPSPLTLRGIIAVDLFGLPADYAAINTLAKDHGLFVIEDAAQSFGAEYNGKKTCSLADIACTSFFPAKPLGCYGDGGMCFTADDELAEIMRSLRIHGQGNHRYENVRIGINGRLDTLQAAILLAKFEIFPEEVLLRQEAADRYTSFLAPCPSLRTPQGAAGCRSVWAQYSLLGEDEDHREAVQKRLRENNIPTAIYYPKPLHLQKAFTFLGYEAGAFPVSENTSQRIFSIPLHPYLSGPAQELIVTTLSQQSISKNMPDCV